MKQYGQQKHGHNDHHATHGGGAHLGKVPVGSFHADELADLEIAQDAQQGPAPNDGHHESQAGQAKRQGGIFHGLVSKALTIRSICSP